MPYTVEQLIQLSQAGFYLPEHLILDALKKGKSTHISEIMRAFGDQTTPFTLDQVKVFLHSLKDQGLIIENKGLYLYSLNTNKFTNYTFNKEPKPFFTFDHFIAQKLCQMQGAPTREQVLFGLIASIDNQLNKIFGNKPFILNISGNDKLSQEFKFLPLFLFTSDPKRPEKNLPIRYTESLKHINDFIQHYRPDFKNNAPNTEIDTSYLKDSIYRGLFDQYGRANFIEFVGAIEADIFFKNNKILHVNEVFLYDWLINKHGLEIGNKFFIEHLGEAAANKFLANNPTPWFSYFSQAVEKFFPGRQNIVYDIFLFSRLSQFSDVMQAIETDPSNTALHAKLDKLIDQIPSQFVDHQSEDIRTQRTEFVTKIQEFREKTIKSASSQPKPEAQETFADFFKEPEQPHNRNQQTFTDFFEEPAISGSDEFKITSLKETRFNEYKANLEAIKTQLENTTDSTLKAKLLEQQATWLKKLKTLRSNSKSDCKDAIGKPTYEVKKAFDDMVKAYFESFPDQSLLNCQEKLRIWQQRWDQTTDPAEKEAIVKQFKAVRSAAHSLLSLTDEDSSYYTSRKKLCTEIDTHFNSLSLPDGVLLDHQEQLIHWQNQFEAVGNDQKVRSNAFEQIKLLEQRAYLLVYHTPKESGYLKARETFYAQVKDVYTKSEQALKQTGQQPQADLPSSPTTKLNEISILSPMPVESQTQQEVTNYETVDKKYIEYDNIFENYKNELENATNHDARDIILEQLKDVRDYVQKLYHKTSRASEYRKGRKELHNKIRSYINLVIKAEGDITLQKYQDQFNTHVQEFEQATDPAQKEDILKKLRLIRNKLQERIGLTPKTSANYKERRAQYDKMREYINSINSAQNDKLCLDQKQQFEECKIQFENFTDLAQKEVILFKLLDIRERIKKLYDKVVKDSAFYPDRKALYDEVRQFIKSIKLAQGDKTALIQKQKFETYKTRLSKASTSSERETIILELKEFCEKVRDRFYQTSKKSQYRTGREALYREIHDYIKTEKATQKTWPSGQDLVSNSSAHQRIERQQPQADLPSSPTTKLDETAALPETLGNQLHSLNTASTPAELVDQIIADLNDTERSKSSFTPKHHLVAFVAAGDFHHFTQIASLLDMDEAAVKAMAQELGIELRDDKIRLPKGRTNIINDAYSHLVRHFGHKNLFNVVDRIHFQRTKYWRDVREKLITIVNDFYVDDSHYLEQRFYKTHGTEKYGLIARDLMEFFVSKELYEHQTTDRASVYKCKDKNKTTISDNFNIHEFIKDFTKHCERFDVLCKVLKERGFDWNYARIIEHCYEAGYYIATSKEHNVRHIYPSYTRNWQIDLVKNLTALNKNPELFGVTVDQLIIHEVSHNNFITFADLKNKIVKKYKVNPKWITIDNFEKLAIEIRNSKLDLPDGIVYDVPVDSITRLISRDNFNRQHFPDPQNITANDVIRVYHQYGISHDQKSAEYIAESIKERALFNIEEPITQTLEPDQTTPRPVTQNTAETRPTPIEEPKTQQPQPATKIVPPANEVQNTLKIDVKPAEVKPDDYVKFIQSFGDQKPFFSLETLITKLRMSHIPVPEIPTLLQHCYDAGYWMGGNFIGDDYNRVKLSKAAKGVLDKTNQNLAEIIHLLDNTTMYDHAIAIVDMIRSNSFKDRNEMALRLEKIFKNPSQLTQQLDHLFGHTNISLSNKFLNRIGAYIFKDKVYLPAPFATNQNPSAFKPKTPKSKIEFFIEEQYKLDPFFNIRSTTAEKIEQFFRERWEKTAATIKTAPVKPSLTDTKTTTIPTSAIRQEAIVVDYVDFIKEFGNKKTHFDLESLITKLRTNNIPVPEVAVLLQHCYQAGYWIGTNVITEHYNRVNLSKAAKGLLDRSNIDLAETFDLLNNTSVYNQETAIVDILRSSVEIKTRAELNDHLNHIFGTENVSDSVTAQFLHKINIYIFNGKIHLPEPFATLHKETTFKPKTPKSKTQAFIEEQRKLDVNFDEKTATPEKAETFFQERWEKILSTTPPETIKIQVQKQKTKVLKALHAHLKPLIRSKTIKSLAEFKDEFQEYKNNYILLEGESQNPFFGIETFIIECENLIKAGHKINLEHVEAFLYDAVTNPNLETESYKFPLEGKTNPTTGKNLTYFNPEHFSSRASLGGHTVYGPDKEIDFLRDDGTLARPHIEEIKMKGTSSDSERFSVDPTVNNNQKFFPSEEKGQSIEFPHEDNGTPNYFQESAYPHPLDLELTAKANPEFDVTQEPDAKDILDFDKLIKTINGKDESTSSSKEIPAPIHKADPSPVYEAVNTIVPDPDLDKKKPSESLEVPSPKEIQDCWQEIKKLKEHIARLEEDTYSLMDMESPEHQEWSKLKDELTKKDAEFKELAYKKALADLKKAKPNSSTSSNGGDKPTQHNSTALDTNTKQRAGQIKLVRDNVATMDPMLDPFGLFDLAAKVTEFTDKVVEVGKEKLQVSQKVLSDGMHQARVLTVKGAQGAKQVVAYVGNRAYVLSAAGVKTTAKVTAGALNAAPTMALHAMRMGVRGTGYVSGQAFGGLFTLRDILSVTNTAVMTSNPYVTGMQAGQVVLMTAAMTPETYLAMGWTTTGQVVARGMAIVGLPMIGYSIVSEGDNFVQHAIEWHANNPEGFVKRAYEAVSSPVTDGLAWSFLQGLDRIRFIRDFAVNQNIFAPSQDNVNTQAIMRDMEKVEQARQSYNNTWNLDADYLTKMVQDPQARQNLSRLLDYLKVKLFAPQLFISRQVAEYALNDEGQLVTYDLQVQDIVDRRVPVEHVMLVRKEEIVDAAGEKHITYYVQDPLASKQYKDDWGDTGRALQTENCLTFDEEGFKSFMLQSGGLYRFVHVTKDTAINLTPTIGARSNPILGFGQGQSGYENTRDYFKQMGHQLLDLHIGELPKDGVIGLMLEGEDRQKLRDHLNSPKIISFMQDQLQRSFDLHFRKLAVDDKTNPAYHQLETFKKQAPQSLTEAKSWTQVKWDEQGQEMVLGTAHEVEAFSAKESYFVDVAYETKQIPNEFDKATAPNYHEANDIYTNQLLREAITLNLFGQTSTKDMAENNHLGIKIAQTMQQQSGLSKEDFIQSMKDNFAPQTVQVAAGYSIYNAQGQMVASLSFKEFGAWAKTHDKATFYRAGQQTDRLKALAPFTGVTIDENGVMQVKTITLGKAHQAYNPSNIFLIGYEAEMGVYGLESYDGKIKQGFASLEAAQDFIGKHPNAITLFKLNEFNVYNFKTMTIHAKKGQGITSISQSPLHSARNSWTLSANEDLSIWTLRNHEGRTMVKGPMKGIDMYLEGYGPENAIIKVAHYDKGSNIQSKMFETMANAIIQRRTFRDDAVNIPQVDIKEGYKVLLSDQDPTALVDNTYHVFNQKTQGYELLKPFDFPANRPMGEYSQSVAEKLYATGLHKSNNPVHAKALFPKSKEIKGQ